ncbi:hypothetical protein LTR53_009367 [Teratosphaeriaceae sp. CCFEE 6253]|nr:hypothetical protein LTR53_009367 [Teratosphaeriaceae sp. CCFEE 6253]
MDEEVLQDRLQNLSDLGLAILVSLISGQHCIFYTSLDAVRGLRKELQSSCAGTFGIETAVVDCSNITVDDFSEAILVDSLDTFQAASGHQDPVRNNSRLAADLYPSRGHSPARHGSHSNNLDDRRIADVIIATNLDLAGSSVQVQALELLRTKRIFTRMAMHTASREFLFIVVASRPDARLSHHLNDMFGLSHYHEDDAGLSYGDVVVEKPAMPIFSRDEIKALLAQADEVRLTAEVDAYLHNVVVFMRQSRSVKSGVTATATRHLRAVAKALALLHGLDYVPPSLVTLAIKKVYPHRVILATAETERTLLWGSDPAAVKEMLRGVTVEDVLEDVIGSDHVLPHASGTSGAGPENSESTSISQHQACSAAQQHGPTRWQPPLQTDRLRSCAFSHFSECHLRRQSKPDDLFTNSPSYLNNMPPSRPHSLRTPTNFPLYHTTRKKPRRWPLVLRFIKGAIHVDITIPVILHAAFAAVVVGLMLVFRNSTSYDRFWQGNQHITAIETCIRNLTRSFLTCSYKAHGPSNTEAERADTERIVRILVGLMYAAKHHLRAEWGASTLPLLMPEAEVVRHRRESHSMAKAEYSELLPPGTRGFEDQGLGLLLQLSLQVEGYIKRGHDRGWFHAPQASQMTAQLNTLVSAYGSLETIHLTPLPVAYLIHMRQVLALFDCVLPFALVREMGWWTIVLTAFVAFTLYGIEAIGAQLEDPFGYDRNDIKIDAIVEDLRVETGVLLAEWRMGSDVFPREIT